MPHQVNCPLAMCAQSSGYIEDVEQLARRVVPRVVDKGLGSNCCMERKGHSWESTWHEQRPSGIKEDGVLGNGQQLGAVGVQ